MIRFLTLALLVGFAPAVHAKVLPIEGKVTTVGAGTGIATGDIVTGMLSFDPADPGCPAFCEVTALDLELPGGVRVALADAITSTTLIDERPAILDGWFTVAGGAYGFADVELVVGNLADGPGTFSLWGDGFTTLLASGDLEVVPLPAALPLLATALGALVWAKRRRAAAAPATAGA